MGPAGERAPAVLESALTFCRENTQAAGYHDDHRLLTQTPQQPDLDSLITQPYPFFRGPHDDAAGQPGVKHVVRLELAGRSGQGGEAGQTQLEAGRRGFGRRRRRRLRRHPLQTETESVRLHTDRTA